MAKKKNKEVSSDLKEFKDFKEKLSDILDLGFGGDSEEILETVRILVHEKKLQQVESRLQLAELKVKLNKAIFS